MNDVTEHELAAATDDVNQARAVEVEHNQIVTVNGQILEHDAEIAQNEANIEGWLDAIKAARKDTRRRQRLQDKLRERRAIFAEAEFRLRQTEQP
jgi:peptidoglycan hydrolase CwlO-like protein